MPPSRDDEPRTQREHEYAQTIARLERELHRSAIEVEHLQETVARQRVALIVFCQWLAFARQQIRTRDEHLEWAEERNRVYRRAIERLA